MFGYLDENDPKRRAPPSYFKVKFHALFIALFQYSEAWDWNDWIIINKPSSVLLISQSSLATLIALTYTQKKNMLICTLKQFDFYSKRLDAIVDNGRRLYFEFLMN